MSIALNPFSKVSNFGKGIFIESQLFEGLKEGFPAFSLIFGQKSDL